MRKKQRKRSRRISTQRSFTLIELIIVFSVVTILSTIGIAGFVNYSRTQALNTATSEVASVLNVAKSRALSQVKPQGGSCTTQSLDGYRVNICGLQGSLCPGKNGYELHAVCGGVNFAVDAKSLPAKIDFIEQGTNAKSVLFSVLTGGVQGINRSGTITLEGHGQKQVITISSVGTITTAKPFKVVPTPTPTPVLIPTPTPTPAPVPTATPTPTPSTKRVFVTSTTYNGNLGGVSGADAKCQSRAAAVNFGSTWRAWVSTNATNAKDRIADGKYIGIDGRLIANNKTDLLDGTLQSKIDRNENNNQEAAKKVWTGSNSDGTAFKDSCNEWTSADDDVKGLRGQTDKTNPNWSNDKLDPCDRVNHLYCFEQ